MEQGLVYTRCDKEVQGAFLCTPDYEQIFINQGYYPSKLCEHKGRLFHGNWNGLIELTSNKKSKDIDACDAMQTYRGRFYVAGGNWIKNGLSGRTISLRKGHCQNLFAYNDKLYLAHYISLNEPEGTEKITLFENVFNSKDIIGSRKTYSVPIMCVHDNILYDASHAVNLESKFYEWDYSIRETISDKLVTKRAVEALCSFDGNLYDGHNFSIMADKNVKKGVFETLSNRQITDRGTRQLCSANGILYDSGENGVYETLTGKKAVGGNIYQIIPVSSEIVEKILRLRKIK